MKIELKEEQKVVIVPEESIMAKEIEVLKIIEIPGRLVQVVTRFTGASENDVKTIVLWEDTEFSKDYTNNRNWTDEKILDRLSELVTK